MKIEKTVYKTVNGTLTTDVKSAAFLHIRAGSDVTPGMLKKDPALNKFMPGYKEPKEKKIQEPDNKMVKAPKNKGAK